MKVKRAGCDEPAAGAEMVMSPRRSSDLQSEGSSEVHGASWEELVALQEPSKSFAPEAAEREASTVEKVKRLVPDLLGIATPSGKKTWETYLRLKRVRDAVTHFKRHDQMRWRGPSTTAAARPSSAAVS